jgi:hypothetical protein|nr:hypothetical protein [uncultured Rhodopila sp.]
MSNSASPFGAAHFAPPTDKDRRGIAKGMMHNFSGMFVSLDDGRNPPWRGMPMVHALSLFSLDPRVDRIETFAERVTVMVGGKKVSRIPAIRLHCGTFRVTVDVVVSPQDAEITEALKWAYSRRGDRYEVLTSDQVKAQPRLRHARLVLCARRYVPPPEVEVGIVRTLSMPGTHTVDSVVRALAGQPNVREAVFAMCTQRRLGINLQAGTPGQMSVWLLPACGRRP